MTSLKKYTATLALAMALAACSSDTASDAAPQTDDFVRVPVTLTIGVHSGLYLTDGGSRADGYVEPRRPLTWKGQQCIRDLRMYAFECGTPDGEYLYAGGGECADGGYLVADFNNIDPVSGANEVHVYDFTPRLKRGRYYKFLAVGRDDSQAMEIPASPKIVSIPWGTKTVSDAEFVVGVTPLHKASLTNMLQNGHYPYITTEIFSGLMTYTGNDGKVKEDYIFVTKDVKGFQKNITLRRAVAALWMYFTDIPTAVADNSGGEYNGEVFTPRSLRIHMETSSPYLNLLGEEKGTDDLHKCRMVGYLDFTNTYGRKINDWHQVEADEYWKRDAFDFQGVHIEQNSALIVNYIIPYDMRVTLDGRQLSTLHLQFYENVLGELETNCLIRCDIKSVTDPITGETTSYTGDPYNYPILPNCIYAIGSPDHPYSLAKLKAAASRGETPELEMTCTPL